MALMFCHHHLFLFCCQHERECSTKAKEMQMLRVTAHCVQGGTLRINPQGSTLYAGYRPCCDFWKSSSGTVYSKSSAGLKVIRSPSARSISISLLISA